MSGLPRVLILAAALGLLLAGAAAAQGGRDVLRGRVVDLATGQPLALVRLALVRNGGRVGDGTTDRQCRYNIRSVPPGRYTLLASRDGYRSLEVHGIVIKAQEITRYDPRMAPSASKSGVPK